MEIKRILYFAALGVLLSACQKEQDIDTDGNTAQVEARITIDGLDVVAQSRAMTQMNDAELKTQGFTVAGYRTEGKFAINAPYHAPNLFNADGTSAPVPRVTYNTTANKFMLDIPKSRAAAGSYLSFFAWSQSTATSGYGITAQSADNAKGYPWIDIVNNPAPDSQNDVTVAAAVDLDNEYLISLVNLNFKHIFSKLSFKVKSSTGNTFKLNSATIKYGADVYTKGRYTFDGSSSIGAWSNLEAPAATEPILNSGMSITGATAVDMGEMMIVPQAVTDGFVSLVISYNLPSGDYTRTIPLKALSLKPNTNYQYTIDITPTSISIGDPRIVGWYDDLTTRMPVVAGPMGDVKLLLDGSEPPYTHTDGTRWWLDHSGYNHHCQIIENAADTKITHDATKKGYVINSKNAAYTVDCYIKIPDLGVIDGTPGKTGVTLEVVSQQALDSRAAMVVGFANVPITTTYTKPTNFGLSAFWLSGRVELDYKKTESTQSTISTAVFTNVDQIKQRGMFVGRLDITSSEKSVWQSIALPSMVYSKAADNAASISLANGGIGIGYNGTVHYVKIISKSITEADIAIDYQALQGKFGLIGKPDPYIEIEAGAACSRIHVVGTGDDARLQLTKAVTNPGAFFQFGSCVAFPYYRSAADAPAVYTPYQDDFTYKDPWNSPMTESYCRDTDVATQVANMKVGIGDPCRLVGYSRGMVKFLLDRGILPDNKTWRTNTRSEVDDYLKEYSSKTTLEGVGGIYLGSGATVDGTGGEFNPYYGRRNANSQQETDKFWIWTPRPWSDSDGTRFWVIDVGSRYIYNSPKTYALNIRCVRQ